MSTTLTNGLKLPDKGSVDWYADMQSNYAILDGAVGTVAEHTSQIAGKAPAVHTHTKSDITDFPVYGTTAGTICEGNDSRLSDARTPVAHTHTKSDVTDLLNSNFIPSANNSYDLGSSSYQWNNLYAKNYFYNGVAWGLDKANAWTQSQTISINQPTFTLQDTIGVRSETPASNRQLLISFLDKNGTSYGFINRQHRTGTGSHLHQVSINNGTYDYRLQFYLFTNGDSNFAPSNNGIIDLGTSTNKWKSFNGINPGALSLPDYNNVLDVTSEVPIASLDGNTTIDLNNYLADKTGWLSIVIDDTAGNFITVTQGRAGGSTAFNNSRSFHTGTQSNGYISVFFPIVAGLSKLAFIKASSLIQMRFYSCLGNV